MSLANFTVYDTAGALFGVLLLGLLLVLPGYAIGAATGLLGFRGVGRGDRLALGLLLSLAVCPVATHLLMRLGGPALGRLFYALAVPAGGIAWACLLRKDVAGAKQRKPDAALIVIGLLWCLVAIAVLVDLHVGRQLFFPYVVPDYTKHISVTAAITRTGVPPVNPSFHPGEPVSLFYYYFWFLLCSLGDRFGGGLLSAGTAAISGAAWAGLILMAAVSQYLRLFRPGEKKRSRRLLLTGVGLLAVGGLDLIPAWTENVIKLTTGRGYFFHDIEWWNAGDQVTNWTGAMVWVPHHVAALAAGLTGLLLLRKVQRHRRPLAVIFAGLAFASATGLSIWVTAIFAGFLVVYALQLVVRGTWRPLASVLATGCIAAVLAGPYLHELISARRPHGGAPLVLTIRSFFPARRLLLALGIENFTAHALVNVLMLPVNYTLELGLFALAGVLYWRRRADRGPDSDDRFLASLLLTSLIACTFLRSTLKFNDFGWRGMMPAQFVLLLWSARYVSGMRSADGTRPRGSLRAALLVLVVLGVLTSAGNLLLLRLSPVLADAGWITPIPWLERYDRLGDRTLAMRRFYGEVDRLVPAEAIVQYNPAFQWEVYHEFYGRRQVVAADRIYGTLYGVAPERYQAVADPITAAFAAEKAEPMGEICRRYDIDLIIVKDRDPAWRNPRSWVWKLEPAVECAYARAFPAAAFGSASP